MNSVNASTKARLSGRIYNLELWGEQDKIDVVATPIPSDDQGGDGESNYTFSSSGNDFHLHLHLYLGTCSHINEK